MVYLFYHTKSCQKAPPTVTPNDNKETLENSKNE